MEGIKRKVGLHKGANIFTGHIGNGSRHENTASRLSKCRGMFVQEAQLLPFEIHHHIYVKAILPMGCFQPVTERKRDAKISALLEDRGSLQWVAET